MNALVIKDNDETITYDFSEANTHCTNPWYWHMTAGMDSTLSPAIDSSDVYCVEILVPDFVTLSRVINNRLKATVRRVLRIDQSHCEYV